MGRYSIIAEVSEKLTDILKAGLVPELLPDTSRIGLCSPDERGEYTVGIYLYGIKQDENYRVDGMQNYGLREQTFPPIDLSLEYMIMVRSQADVTSRSLDEQRILGRIIQIFHDNNLLKAEDFGGGNSPDMRIEFRYLKPDEAKAVWGNDKEAYRTSLFYSVAPVEIESERRRTVGRVTDVEIHVGGRVRR